MPQTYRKKPVEIEAVQFAGGASAATPLIDWMLGNGATASWHEAYELVVDAATGLAKQVPEGIRISTLEGDMLATVGDWIIRGVQGEFYPCKPDIFEATYDPVS